MKNLLRLVLFLLPQYCTPNIFVMFFLLFSFSPSLCFLSQVVLLFSISEYALSNGASYFPSLKVVSVICFKLLQAHSICFINFFLLLMKWISISVSYFSDMDLEIRFEFYFAFFTKRNLWSVWENYKTDISISFLTFSFLSIVVWCSTYDDR